MTKHRNDDTHGPVHRPRRRFGRAPLLLAALLGALVAGPLLAAPTPAQAQNLTATSTPAPVAPTETATTATATPTPTPTPTDGLRAPSAAPTPTSTPTMTPTPTPEPAAPTIAAPAPNALLGGSITVAGSRTPDQEIQLLSPTGGDPFCIVEPDGTTTWACPNVDLPNGPAITLRAVVTGSPDLAATVTVRVLHAPSVTGGSTGQASSNGMVRGTGHPGATVTATLSSGQRCSFTVDASGAWACLMEGGLVSGREQITASQQTGYSAPGSSPASDPVTLVFDVDAPAAPVLAGPAAGATLSPTGSRFSGQGENGATVTVFAGPYSLCSAVVAGGTWSCTGGRGVAAGSYDLRAVQQDAAGNVSAGSPAIPVRYGAAVPAPAPVPSPTMAAVTPATPTAAPPSATPAPTADGRPTPAPALPNGPEDPAETLPPALIVPGGWNDPTPFTSSVIPPWTVAQFPWLQAVLLTLGALGLLVIPARLLAGTVSRARNGRPLFTALRFAGRNRAREEFEVAPTVRFNRVVVGAAALVVAAVCVLLSGPVASAPAYLRLFLAVALALGVVNVVAALVPQWWGSRALHVHVHVSSTLLPRYLLLVAVTALGSRALDLHPALLFGLLGGVVVSQGPARAQRGQLAAIRAASLLGLGLVALLVVGTLPTADTFFSALAAEFANTVVLAAIGSAALVLIPVGNTSGRSILAWSPPIWAALAVPSFLTLFALLSPMLPRWQGGTGVLVVLLAATFAVLSVAAWAWQRYVTPAVR